MSYKYQCYIGIDPGKDGAITIQILDEKKQWDIRSFKIPLLADKDYDVKGLISILQGTQSLCATYNKSMLVALEDVHSLHNTSAKSNFSFGYGVGLLRGCVVGLNLPFVLINAKKWQKLCFEGVPIIDKIGPIARGRGLTDTKKMALISAQRLYPSLCLNFGGRASTPHKGLIDSLMISHYIKMTY